MSVILPHIPLDRCKLFMGLIFPGLSEALNGLGLSIDTNYCGIRGVLKTPEQLSKSEMLYVIIYKSIRNCEEIEPLILNVLEILDTYGLKAAVDRDSTSVPFPCILKIQSRKLIHCFECAYKEEATS